MVPALHHDPARAIDQLEAVFEEPGGVTLLVGSSLGAYYATWLSEKYNTRAVLINPAVSPQKHLGQEFLGSHANYHTGEQFELTQEHVATLASLDCEQLRHPENFMLLLQTGDEVLDYRLAVAHYQGSEQIIQEGGDHSFTGFEAMLPRILAFAGFQQSP